MEDCSGFALTLAAQANGSGQKIASTFGPKHGESPACHRHPMASQACLDLGDARSHPLVCNKRASKKVCCPLSKEIYQRQCGSFLWGGHQPSVDMNSRPRLALLHLACVADTRCDSHKLSRKAFTAPSPSQMKKIGVPPGLSRPTEGFSVAQFLDFSVAGFVLGPLGRLPWEIPTLPRAGVRA